MRRSLLTFVLALALAACSPFGEARIDAPGADAGTTPDGATAPACGTNVLNSGFADLTGFTKVTAGVSSVGVASTRFLSAPSALRAESDGPNSHAYVFHAFAVANGAFCSQIAFAVLVEDGPTTGAAIIGKVRLRNAPINEGLDLVVTQDLRLRVEQGMLTSEIGVLAPGAFTRVGLSIVAGTGSQTMRTDVDGRQKQIDLLVPAQAGMYELDLGVLPSSAPITVYLDDVVLDVGTR